MDTGLYWNINAEAPIFIPWGLFARMPLLLTQGGGKCWFRTVTEDGCLLQYRAADEKGNQAQIMYSVFAKLQKKFPNRSEEKKQYFDMLLSEMTDKLQQEKHDTRTERSQIVFMQLMASLAQNARQQSIAERIKINCVLSMIENDDIADANVLIPTVGKCYSPLAAIKEGLEDYAKACSLPQLSESCDEKKIASPLLHAIQNNDIKYLQKHGQEADCFGMTLPLYFALFQCPDWEGAVLKCRRKENKQAEKNILQMDYDDLAALETREKKFEYLAQLSKEGFKLYEEWDRLSRKYHQIEDDIDQTNRIYNGIRNSMGPDPISTIQNQEDNERAENRLLETGDELIEVKGKLDTVCRKKKAEAENRRENLLNRTYEKAVFPDSEKIAKANAAITNWKRDIPSVPLLPTDVRDSDRTQIVKDIAGTPEGEEILQRERSRIVKEFTFREKDEFETSVAYAQARDQAKTDYIEKQLELVLRKNPDLLKITVQQELQDDEAAAIVSAYRQWKQSMDCAVKDYQTVQREIEDSLKQNLYSQFWPTMIQTAMTPETEISAYNADKESFEVSVILTSRFDETIRFKADQKVKIPLAAARQFKQSFAEAEKDIVFSTEVQSLESLHITAQLDCVIEHEPYHFEFENFKRCSSKAK